MVTYEIWANAHFALKVETRGGHNKAPILILEESLDREKGSTQNRITAAKHKGAPQRSGTLHMSITVLESNNNAPAFDGNIYTICLVENVDKGILVIG